MKNLVNNKIVDCAVLKSILENKFGSFTFYDSKDELSCHIDNFIQTEVELPAYDEQVMINPENATTDIYENIDNVDEFRDCVGNFVDEHWDTIQDAKEN